MFWANQDDPTLGDFYMGTIRGRRRYKKDGPVPPYLRDSTWEQLCVTWDESNDQEQTWVNVWEIFPLEELQSRWVGGCWVDGWVVGWLVGGCPPVLPCLSP